MQTVFEIGFRAFEKTPKEKAELSTAKARYIQPNKRRLNNQSLQNQFLKSITNSKERFSLECTIILTGDSQSSNTNDIKLI